MCFCCVFLKDYSALLLNADATEVLLHHYIEIDATETKKLTEENNIKLVERFGKCVCNVETKCLCRRLKIPSLLVLYTGASVSMY